MESYSPLLIVRDDYKQAMQWSVHTVKLGMVCEANPAKKYGNMRTCNCLTVSGQGGVAVSSTINSVNRTPFAYSQHMK